MGIKSQNADQQKICRPKIYTLVPPDRCSYKGYHPQHSDQQQRLKNVSRVPYAAKTVDFPQTDHRTHCLGLEYISAE
jgi:hypothetical protein